MPNDAVDQRILEALSRNARMPLKELADVAGLSSPSAAERVRRLEDRGVISAFTIDLDLQALGYPLQAIVRVRPLPVFEEHHGVGAADGDLTGLVGLADRAVGADHRDVMAGNGQADRARF